MSYPEGYYRYFELFNQEEFWESHEALEEIWMHDRTDDFLRGLILLSAAFVHVQRNNPSGCRKVLEKCIARLSPYRPRRWDLDLEPILAHAALCLERLASLPEGVHLRDHLPFIRLSLESSGQG